MNSLKTTNVYARHVHYYNELKKAGHPKPIIIHEGGGRSSKTTSIIQKFGVDSYTAKKPLQITICRLKMTWTRLSVLRDFGKFISEYGIPVEPQFNASRAIQEYMMFGSLWNFIGLDDTMKLPGMEHDKVWINEAMESTLASFNQLDMRAADEVVIDYNPMALNHWVYNIALRPEARVIKSTQLDNPYLAEGVRKTILSYEPTPENVRKGTADKYYWDVYGLGKKAVQKGRIFKNVTYENEWPECQWEIYGLDFGYTNDPTALVKIGLSEGKLYWKQLIYETGLTNIPGPDSDRENIHSRLQDLGIRKTDLIIADSAEPKSIAELRKAGWSVRPAKKGPDSIVNGIDAIKRYPIVVISESMDLKKEFENYKWVSDKDGNLINKPVDMFNHGIDAGRYAATHRIQIKKKTARFSI